MLIHIFYLSTNFQPHPGFPASRQRRIASCFRDQSLLQIFQISLSSLHHVKNDGNKLTLVDSVIMLWLILTCQLTMSFHNMFSCSLSPKFCILTKDSVGSKMQELAISLSLSCLSFDFLGTSFDESSDVISTIQV